MIALDTNLLVRLLTNDDPRQSAKVERWLHEHATAQTPVYVDHVVLCELAWVLERSYGYPRREVHRAIQSLLDFDQLKIEATTQVTQALAHYAEGSADFSDYLLAVRTSAAGCASVLTLDKEAARSSTHTLLR